VAAIFARCTGAPIEMALARVEVTRSALQLSGEGDF
jgi:hypothetical protein